MCFKKKTTTTSTTKPEVGKVTCDPRMATSAAAPPPPPQATVSSLPVPSSPRPLPPPPTGSTPGASVSRPAEVTDVSEINLLEDDFGCSDEVKIFKDECEDEEKEFASQEELQAALSEDKTSLIQETEFNIKQEQAMRLQQDPSGQNDIGCKIPRLAISILIFCFTAVLWLKQWPIDIVSHIFYYRQKRLVFARRITL